MEGYEMTVHFRLFHLTLVKDMKGKMPESHMRRKKKNISLHTFPLMIGGRDVFATLTLVLTSTLMHTWGTPNTLQIELSWTRLKAPGENLNTFQSLVIICQRKV